MVLQNGFLADFSLKSALDKRSKMWYIVVVILSKNLERQHMTPLF
jgi:hypothetical protein